VVQRLRRSEEHAAFDVARHLIEYGAYGGSHRTAVRALRRRLDAISAARAERLLYAAIDLLSTAKRVVAKHEASLWEAWNSETLQLAENAAGKSLRRAFPRFSQGTCDLAVAWVFYWHYLR
jgi:hypothetical protein